MLGLHIVIIDFYLIRRTVVLDLWDNQRGVSKVFLTYFDYFSGGQYNWGVERHQRGLPPPPPPTNRALKNRPTGRVATFEKKIAGQ